MDRLSEAQRRLNMQAVKSKGSRIERSFARVLWARGLRYRKNDKTVFGKPDLTFKKRKIAIFIDSEFWHGKDFSEGKNIPTSNTSFWVSKFQKNIQRDTLVNEILTKDGWNVIRIWARELKRDIQAYADIVERELGKK